MAQCTLDLDHPFFQSAIAVFENDLEFHEGLRIVKDKIEAEHKSCNHVVQPMPGHTDCQNKIWKYDWAPAGARSSTRKSWRMVVVVPEPDARPLRLIAAAFYSKNQASQLTTKQLLQIFAGIMAGAKGETPDQIIERFKRVTRADGQTASICVDCGETWIAETMEILDCIEAQHACPGPITA